PPSAKPVAIVRPCMKEQQRGKIHGRVPRPLERGLLVKPCALFYPLSRGGGEAVLPPTRRHDHGRVLRGVPIWRRAAGGGHDHRRRTAGCRTLERLKAISIATAFRSSNAIGTAQATGSGSQRGSLA